MTSYTWERQGYRITSYGNGSAYAITDLGTEYEIFLQGDDSVAIEQETNDWDNLEILSEYFACINQPC